MQTTIQPCKPHLPVSSEQQDHVLILAGEVRRLVGLACAMAVSGRRVSLAGLENAVGLLCAKALDLPPNEAGPVRAQLLLLAAELDRLTAATAPNQASVPGVLPD